jgi:predicted metal-dependent HD superfamily phosphohydrolase
MDYRSITEQAQHYVRTYFDTHADDQLIYHNLYHTQQVVKAAIQIARHYNLNETDLFIVQIAAWFHDIGYLTGGAAGHEERGAKLVEAYLQGTGVEPSVIDDVRHCILATQLPQRAVSLTEQIVCDADLFHLGTNDFEERNKLMRKEAEAVRHEKISKEDWRKSAIRLLEGHQYYTDYCRLLLGDKQQENLAQLKHKEEEHERHEAGKKDDPAGEVSAGRREGAADTGSGSSVGGMEGVPVDSKSGSSVRGLSGVRGGKAEHGGEGGHGGEGRHQGDERHEGKQSADAVEKLVRKHLLAEDGQESPPAAVQGKKAKKKDPGRGIDTVFRITSNNNQRLSSQADSKAHILIQVNSIIISVLLSLLLRKIEDHTNLAIPAIILLTVNLVTIIFSILATRPHIPPGKFTQADLEEKKVNLLFFGNFYLMSLEEYAGGMLQLLEDRDFLYGSLIRDVYYQGIALGKKYRWLRLSYNVFMYGLIASVISFLIAALVYPQK